ncbi:enoyl-CoA hydratase/isomerase family protein [Comamonas testosteroni]|uniref:enoyl-CoA hydratase/isomerase family protein n=1 Tax=Comamonas testosteroni TaxID=285 RepID=UPI00391B6C6B
MTTTPETSPVLTSVQDGIGTITLNRPEARNALNHAMRPALAAAVAQMRDDAQVHTVILTGAGGAFCSGGDISQMMDARQAGLPWRQRMRSLHQWFPELVNLEKPVIAAVDGPAFGAGLSLALAADFVLCTRRAKFCAVFGRIGLVPDLGAMHMLPRIVGLQKAKELVFTARTVQAEEARSLGMVYEIVEDGEALQAAAVALARRFGEASTAAIGMAKTAMNQAFELDARAMAELEAYAQTMCRGSDYHQEAVQRFKDKQPTRFDWDRAP